MHRWLWALIVVTASLAWTGWAHGAPLSAADRRARAQALSILRKAQTLDHRKAFQIEVPPVPSDLPARYVIRHQASAPSEITRSWLIEVRRDERGAEAERLDDRGFSIAPLPVERVDALVRLAFYLHGAKAVLRDEPADVKDVDVLGGGTSPFPWKKVEFDGPGLSIATVHTQPVTRALHGPTLDDFALTTLTEALEDLVSAHMEPKHRLARSPALLQRMEQRLREIPRGDTDLSRDDRTEREAIEARLLGHLLVQAGAAYTVPLLRRKGLDLMAYELSLATMSQSDLEHALPGLLCSRTPEISEPARRAVIDNHALSPAALIGALGCSTHDFEQMFLLDFLGGRTLEPGTSLTPLRRLLVDERQPSRLRIRMAAAAVLWGGARDEGAHQLLRQVARGPAGQRSQLQHSQIVAFRALLSGGDSPGAIQEVANLAADILRDLWLDAPINRLALEHLMQAIVATGEPHRAAELVPWLEHREPDVVQSTIELFDQLDPSRASFEMRAALDRYARDGDAESWSRQVEPFVQLLVRRDDTSAIEPLRRAEQTLVEHVSSDDDRRRRLHAALVRYLEAKPARRAAAALRVVEHLEFLDGRTTAALIERHARLDEDDIHRAHRSGAR